MDLYNRVWECKDRDSDYVCPGQLNTLCPEDEFKVQCECAGELWMVPDCQEVKKVLSFSSLILHVRPLSRCSSTFVMLPWTTMCSQVKSLHAQKVIWLWLTLPMEIHSTTLVWIEAYVSNFLRHSNWWKV